MQAKSRAFATEQIDLQRADFKRLGVLGDWDHPYRTMDFSNEADEIRAFFARLRGKPRPAGIDVNVLTPITMTVFAVLAVLTAILLIADIFNPVSLNL